MEETSFRQASAKVNERYRGKASARLYEDMSVSVASSSENLCGSSIIVVLAAKSGLGGSSAENAGVKLHIVHALSGVGSSWVVRDSYTYEKSSVMRVR